MSILQRLRNLWQLSRFEITRFDQQLVITEKDNELVFARPEMAQIIKKQSPIDEFINNN